MVHMGNTQWIVVNKWNYIDIQDVFFSFGGVRNIFSSFWAGEAVCVVKMKAGFWNWTGFWNALK